MASTSARMLQLLSLLQTHRHWPGDDLCTRLEVSERTLRRDIDRLRDLGYQVDATRGLAGGYQLRAGAALPPLLIDDEEAVAIAVGLRSAAAGSVSDDQDVSVRALTKVVGVMPPRLRRRVAALQDFTVPAVFGGGPTVDAVALTVLAQACRDTERVRFDYTRADGESAARHVEPHRLVSLGRRWYLVSYDLERHDWRSFRVDRLTEPRPTGAKFRQRELPAADAAEFVRGGIDARAVRMEVEVVVHAPLDDVKGTVDRWGRLEPIDDSSCRLRMSVDDPSWVMLMLGAIGAEFELVGAPELQDYLRRVGELFLRATA